MVGCRSVVQPGDDRRAVTARGASHRDAWQRTRAVTWLLPSALGIAAVAAAALVALHFIAHRRPVTEVFPTARFIPARSRGARSASNALTDLAVLALRFAAILAIGAGAAGPSLTGRRHTTRIVLADRSRAIRDAVELQDSVNALRRPGDVVIAFDSAADRAATVAVGNALGRTDARGSLSAAIAAAIRESAHLRSAGDSVDLLLISPVVREEIDEATFRLRSVWPGGIRVVPIRAASVPNGPLRVEVVADRNDVVRAGLELMGVAAAVGDVRVIRDAPTAADSTWVRIAGHVLVVWPASDSVASWPRRQTIDAIGGVTSAGGGLIARFPRPWVLHGVAVARWIDGEPAAVETRTGNGCIRDVGILLDPASDVALRRPFRRFAASLLAPCGGSRAVDALDARGMTVLAGAGSLAAVGSLRDTTGERAGATPMLLGIAALFLLAELVVRRARGRAS